MSPLNPKHPEREIIDSRTLVQEFESLRPKLRGYILSILPHPSAIDDIMQETMILLWEKRADYTQGTNFKAWAFKVAYFKTLSYRRDLQRNKVVTLSEDLLHRIAGAAEEQTEEYDGRFLALQDCLDSLAPKDQQLLKATYVDKQSLTDQARQLDVPPNRLQKAVSRTRMALRSCIQRKLSQTP
ncbi:RNA polymerase sigma-70 factor, ECF subfamily [Rubritalea squalenifaciens DSM 18772]|uniref:RNA polymerase sigma-70 factor, ECF subfamily n=1 Tax=Rubritalea squalenifaciens DSM 18772 TaxID=1123071 RepID=A0A1M6DPF8_9BACT|nr:sigma-70 family RNA polymerase sigma factor [Rubritalea squalenifaciens]SHI75060.1 RNA polymerase sigma-70 factor, ECF subfamily [Rubritalea squalenifaciens DSM 18772]